MATGSVLFCFFGAISFQTPSRVDPCCLTFQAPRVTVREEFPAPEARKVRLHFADIFQSTVAKLQLPALGIENPM